MTISRAQDEALDAAERQIQHILLNLEDEHGLKIENVEVDTRNFANLRVEIFAAPVGRGTLATTATEGAKP